LTFYLSACPVFGVRYKLLKNYKNPEDLLGKNGIFKTLQKALIEKILQSEMTHHLGFEKNGRVNLNV
jgi:transposase-like protein